MHRFKMGVIRFIVVIKFFKPFNINIVINCHFPCVHSVRWSECRKKTTNVRRNIIFQPTHHAFQMHSNDMAWKNWKFIYREALANLYQDDDLKGVENCDKNLFFFQNIAIAFSSEINHEHMICDCLFAYKR